MRFTPDQWGSLVRAASVGAVFSDNPTSKAAEPVIEAILQGVVHEGVDPLLGPARHELIHALRGLVAHVNKIEANKITNPLVTNDLLTALVRAEKVLEACDEAALLG